MKMCSFWGHPVLFLLVNWCSKMNVVVRWKGCYSDSFLATSGVRQARTLSPSLFTVFMNVFAVRLKALGTGCCIGCYLLACILYADDVILLSACIFLLLVLPRMSLNGLFLCWCAVKNLYSLSLSLSASIPLMGTGNYSATSNNMKLVHCPLMGGLLHLVQRWRD